MVSTVVGGEPPPRRGGPDAQGAAGSKPAATTRLRRSLPWPRRTPVPRMRPNPRLRLTGPRPSRPRRFLVQRATQLGSPGGSGSITRTDSRSCRRTSTTPRSRSGSGARTCSATMASPAGRPTGRIAPATGQPIANSNYLRDPPRPDHLLRDGAPAPALVPPEHRLQHGHQQPDRLPGLRAELPLQPGVRAQRGADARSPARENGWKAPSPRCKGPIDRWRPPSSDPA